MSDDVSPIETVARALGGEDWEARRGDAEKVIAALNAMPWTSAEIDTGARAVVERIRIASRVAMSGRDPREPKLNVYAPMTDNDWRQFRNTPICAKSILDVNLIFKVLKRIPE